MLKLACLCLYVGVMFDGTSLADVPEQTRVERLGVKIARPDGFYPLSRQQCEAWANLKEQTAETRFPVLEAYVVQGQIDLCESANWNLPGEYLQLVLDTQAGTEIEPEVWSDVWRELTQRLGKGVIESSRVCDESTDALLRKSFGGEEGFQLPSLLWVGNVYEETVSTVRVLEIKHAEGERIAKRLIFATMFVLEGRGLVLQAVVDFEDVEGLVSGLRKAKALSCGWYERIRAKPI